MSNDLLIVQFVKNGGSGSKILKTDLRQVSGIKPVKTYLKDFFSNEFLRNCYDHRVAHCEVKHHLLCTATLISSPSQSPLSEENKIFSLLMKILFTIKLMVLL